MMMFLRTPLTKRALKGAFAIMIVTSCEMPVFVLPPLFLVDGAHAPWHQGGHSKGRPSPKGSRRTLKCKKRRHVRSRWNEGDALAPTSIPKHLAVIE